jgi:glycosyltransferase involved in cell wall biosynthesis
MLSILIPTAGRDEVLPVVLRSVDLVRTMTDYPTEVIVIDNNQNEELVQRVQQQCDGASLKVRYVREPSPGLSAARHRGADEAEGDLLVFLDDDVELSPGWLRGMIAGFENEAVGICGGPSIPRFTSSVPAWLWDFVAPTRYGGWYCTWESLLDIGRPVADIDPNFVWGLNFGIRRSVLRELGGFHPDLLPPHLQRWQGDGETGLTLKAKEAGVKATYVPEAMLFHHIGPDRLTFAYFCRRARYQGVCDSFTQIRAGKAPDWSPQAASKGKAPKAQAHRTWQAASSELHNLISQAYREGFEYHQTEAADDPRLMDWILRETYWGSDIRTELEAFNRQK